MQCNSMLLAVLCGLPALLLVVVKQNSDSYRVLVSSHVNSILIRPFSFTLFSAGNKTGEWLSRQLTQRETPSFYRRVEDLPRPPIHLGSFFNRPTNGTTWYSWSVTPTNRAVQTSRIWSNAFALSSQRPENTMSENFWSSEFLFSKSKCGGMLTDILCCRWSILSVIIHKATPRRRSVSIQDRTEWRRDRSISNAHPANLFININWCGIAEKKCFSSPYRQNKRKKKQKKWAGL